MIECPTCRDSFESVEEYTKHVLSIQNKRSTDFETPLMRDIGKLSWQILLGLIGAIGFILLFVFPFGITEFCNHGMVTTSNNIFGMIVSDITGVCTYV